MVRQNAGEDGQTDTHYEWEYKMVWPFEKIVFEFLTKLNMHL